MLGHFFKPRKKTPAHSTQHKIGVERARRRNSGSIVCSTMVDYNYYGTRCWRNTDDDLVLVIPYPSSPLHCIMPKRSYFRSKSRYARTYRRSARMSRLSRISNIKRLAFRSN